MRKYKKIIPKISVLIIGAGSGYLVIKILIKLITKTYVQSTDFNLIIIAMWMAYSIYIYSRYIYVYKSNEVLLNILRKLFNSIYIIREANNRGIHLSQLEKGGLFDEINKEITSIIGEQKETTVKFVKTPTKSSGRNIN